MAEHTLLSERDRLRLQQLRLLEWIESSGRGEDQDEPEQVERALELPGIAPTFTRGLKLHPWQIEARDRWFDSGCRGTVKVVTGAGKTVVGLAIAERLAAQDPDLRIAVLVPTIVLMNQWYDALLTHSDLPSDAIARLGGGHSGAFGEDVRVVLAVLATARKELPQLVRKSGAGDHLLLIADECHRVGAAETSNVLQTPRRYSLGLSATPERIEDDTGEGGGYDESLVGEELGSIVYEMDFAKAVSLDVLPPFEVDHYGLPLDAKEAHQYSSLTRSINDMRKELLAASPSARKAGGGDSLVVWARRVAARDSQFSALAARYVADTTRRKMLLYRARARAEATTALIEEALAARPDARVILFHEAIEEVVRLFQLLERKRIPAVMEHSELSNDLRESSLDLFRRGTAKVVVSARSLIEGFNVPEADLGIIVASSSSPRQRIQSIGRVLRRYRGTEGEEKHSRIAVLYVRDTVDEAIYEKEDWDRLIGLDRNRYFTWDPPRSPDEQTLPPRAAIPKEQEIDVGTLEPGDEYPGRYAGAEYSSDTRGNVLDPDGRVAMNPQGVPALVERFKGRPGRFRVTSRNKAILVLESTGDEEWRTVFAGSLKAPFDFQARIPAGFEEDVSALRPGEEYRGPLEPAEQFRFRRTRGGVIAKRVRGGEVFARGDDAERLASVLLDLSRTEGAVSKIFVNELGHVFYRDAGLARFVTALHNRLEFPEGRER